MNSPTLPVADRAVRSLAHNLPAFSSNQLPSDIQWMPPGEHEVAGTKGDEPASVRVTVSPSTAEVMTALLRDLTAKAAAGEGDRPYIDFNHEDRAASAHILEFHWGGDDPLAGGVRARVEWTEPGRQALLGRAYRRFSPSFYVNANGEVTGAPLNMGGLVNRAAFRTIQPIWSREQAEPVPLRPFPSSTPNNMDSNDPLKTTQAALAAAQADNLALKSRLGAIEADPAFRAKDAEISALKTKIAGLEGQVKAHRSERARARVQDAILAGRLAPQASEVHAKWAALIEADEKNADLLDAMPVNAALATIVQNWSSGPSFAGHAATPDAFVALVKAKQTNGKTRSEALDAAIAENPQSYRAWREASGHPAL